MGVAWQGDLAVAWTQNVTKTVTHPVFGFHPEGHVQNPGHADSVMGLTFEGLTVLLGLADVAALAFHLPEAEEGVLAPLLGVEPEVNLLNVPGQPGVGVAAIADPTVELSAAELIAPQLLGGSHALGVLGRLEDIQAGLGGGALGAGTRIAHGVVYGLGFSTVLGNCGVVSDHVLIRSRVDNVLLHLGANFIIII